MTASLRDALKNSIFQFAPNGERHLRLWALIAMTIYWAAVWKGLIELDKVIPNEFWLAVLGQDPVGALGPNGFLLLTLYALGTLVWFFVTALLLKLTGECARRLGL